MKHAKQPMPTPDEVRQAIATLMEIAGHITTSYLKIVVADRRDGDEYDNPLAVIVTYAVPDESKMKAFIVHCLAFERAQGLDMKHHGDDVVPVTEG